MTILPINRLDHSDADITADLSHISSRKQSMYLFAAAIRALCSRRPIPSSAKQTNTNRRVKRAARATVEAMEQRVLLSVSLPPCAQLSADVAYAVTGVPGNYDVDFTSGSFVLNADLSKASSDWQNVTIVLGDGTTGVFNSPQTLGGLQLAGNAKLTASTGGGGANGNYIVVGPAGLSMSTASTIDLTDNDMILQGAGSAGVLQVQSLVSHAYNGGNWKGSGLGSSNAALSVGAAMQTAEGFALNGNLTTPFGTFDGVSVTSADVIDRYTVAADANLDGVVNLTDYRILRNNLNKTGMTWATGDFNYNSTTDTADYSILQANYLGTIYGPNEARVLQPVGQTIAASYDKVYTGPLITFTDSNNPTAAASTVSYYAASIDWGDNNFVPASLAANGNGGFTVSGTSPFPLTDPNALITMDVGYAAGSPYAGQPSALSTPITLVPQAITGLSATASSASQILLSWNVAVTDATGVQLSRSTDGTNFNVIATLPGNSGTYTDSALIEGTHYWYSVTAQPHTGAAATAAADVWTLPAAPTGLTASVISSNQVNLAWVNNSGGSPAFEIDRSPDNVGFDPIFTTAGAATSYTDLSVYDNTTYYYRITPLDASGNPGSPTNTVQVATPVSVLSTLASTPCSDTELDFTWLDNSGGTAAPQLWRSTDSVNWTLVASLAAGTVSFHDTGLAPNTPYDYYVSAVGAPAATASSNFEQNYTLPSAPTGLTATPSGGDVILSWTNTAQSIFGEQVLESADGVTFSEIATVPAGTSTYDDWHAPDGVMDYYEVCSVSSGGYSAASGVASADPIDKIRMTDSTPATGTNFTVVHGQSLSIASGDVLAKDVDPNNNPVIAIGSFTQPSHGTVTVDGCGNFVYLANLGYVGTDSFTYMATDQYHATSAAATVQVQVTDVLPEADGDQIFLPEAKDSQGNYLNYAAPVTYYAFAHDTEFDALTWSVVSGPTAAQGAFVMNAQTGQFTFTPNPSATSMDTLNVVYKVNDGALDSNLASLVFPGYNIVTPGTDQFVAAPTFGGNQYDTVSQNGTLEVASPALLTAAFDEDPRGPPTDPDAPSVGGLIAYPQHGALTNLDQTRGGFTYQPAAGYTGRDFFTYTIVAGSKLGGYVTVFIDVNPITASLSVDTLAAGDPTANIPSSRSKAVALQMSRCTSTSARFRSELR